MCIRDSSSAPASQLPYFFFQKIGPSGHSLYRHGPADWRQSRSDYRQFSAPARLPLPGLRHADTTRTRFELGRAVIRYPQTPPKFSDPCDRCLTWSGFQNRCAFSSSLWSAARLRRTQTSAAHRRYLNYRGHKFGESASLSRASDCPSLNCNKNGRRGMRMHSLLPAIKVKVDILSPLRYLFVTSVMSAPSHL